MIITREYEDIAPSTTDVIVLRSFVQPVVKYLGLCMPVTDYLRLVLNLNAIAQIVVSVTGIVGAAISLRITSIRRNRSSLSVQVAMLSLYDIFFLSAVLVIAILRVSDVECYAAEAVFHVVRGLGLWGVNYTMVDITIERCLFIDRPFLARKICHVGLTMKKSAVIFAAGVVLVVPSILDYIFGLSVETDCSRERTLTTYGVVYTLYTSVLLFYLIPFMCILLANVKLVCSLYHFGKRSQIMTANSSVQADASAKQLSVFVVGMCFWYVVFMFAPSMLFFVRLSRFEPLVPEMDITVAVVADTLVVLSTAANFMFYFLMWRNFRHVFLLMFCRRCGGRDRSLVPSGGCISHANHGDHVKSPKPIQQDVQNM